MAKEFKIKPEVEETVVLPQGLVKGLDQAKNGEFVKSPLEPNYTRFLLGSYTDPVNGEWKTVQFPFDPVTMQVGSPVSERVAGDIEVLREKVAIKLINLGVLEHGVFKQEKKIELY